MGSPEEFTHVLIALLQAGCVIAVVAGRAFPGGILLGSVFAGGLLSFDF